MWSKSETTFYLQAHFEQIIVTVNNQIKVRVRRPDVPVYPAQMLVLKVTNQRSGDISRYLFHPCLQSLKSQPDERVLSSCECIARDELITAHACGVEMLPCKDGFTLADTVLFYVRIFWD